MGWCLKIGHYFLLQRPLRVTPHNCPECSHSTLCYESDNRTALSIHIPLEQRVKTFPIGHGTQRFVVAVP